FRPQNLDPGRPVWKLNHGIPATLNASPAEWKSHSLTADEPMMKLSLVTSPWASSTKPSTAITNGQYTLRRIAQARDSAPTYFPPGYLTMTAFVIPLWSLSASDGTSIRRWTAPRDVGVLF